MKKTYLICFLFGLIGCDGSTGTTQKEDELSLSSENGFLRAEPQQAVIGTIISDALLASSKLEFRTPSNGTITDLGEGKFEYLADANATTDSFDIRLRNNYQISNWATIQVRIAQTPEQQVLDYGVAGFNTKDVLDNIDIIRGNYPDLALIMIGTNDSITKTKRLDLETYKLNLSRIVNYILSTGAHVVLMTIPPVIAEYLVERYPEDHFSEFGGPNETIDAYNQVILETAQIHQLSLFDTHKLVMDNGGNLPSADSYIRNEFNRNTRDGVHLTVNGYESIAQNLERQLGASNIKHYNIATIGDSITKGIQEKKSYPEYLAEFLNYLYTHPSSESI